MNTILIICAIILTFLFSIGIVYLVLALIQIRKTAKEAQVLFQALNKEIDSVNRITYGVTMFFKNFCSPLINLSNWVKELLNIEK